MKTVQYFRQNRQWCYHSLLIATLAVSGLLQLSKSSQAEEIAPVGSQINSTAVVTYGSSTQPEESFRSTSNQVNLVIQEENDTTVAPSQSLNMNDRVSPDNELNEQSSPMDRTIHADSEVKKF